MSRVEYLKKVDGERYLSLDEASLILGVKTSALRNYLYRDRMTTYKFKTMTLLSKREVEDWKGRQK